MRSLPSFRQFVPVACIALVAVSALVISSTRESVSAVVTRTVSSAGFHFIGPQWISDATLVVLAIGTAAALAWSWKNRSRDRVLLLSTLAFGAVWLITIAVGAVWSTLLSSALASVVAIGRMLEGVHYLHDVAAGAELGLAVPALVTGVVVLGRASRTRMGAHRPRLLR